jgi:2-(1,2-epoxy-1,2-dihydrophenyl)acetyl-CoA isomerase
MPDFVLLEKHGAVATLTFNRPEVRNAIDQESIGMIHAALLDVERDPALRVLVVTGAGDHFIAGGDVNFFKRSLEWSPEERRARFADVVRRIHPVITTLRRLPQPVIASVRGAAAGWGVSLVLACDLAIAADNARFSMGYTAVGACPEGSGSYFLPRAVGLKKAMQLALFSERIDAHRAEALGIVNRVVPLKELNSATAEWAERLAGGPGIAIAATKRLLEASLSNPLDAQLEDEALAFGECAASQDFGEGTRAFLERRKPKFRSH